MEMGLAYWVIANVMLRRSNKISRHQAYDGRDDQCTYCGLTRAHQREKQCFVYGSQCNIYEKFNHFSSVYRANINQEEVMDQRSPPLYNGKNKRGIKRTKGQKRYILAASQLLMRT